MDKRKEYQHEYYLAHKERHSQKAKERYANLTEEQRERIRAYQRSKRSLLLKSKRKYERAMEDPEWAKQEKIKRHNNYIKRKEEKQNEQRTING